ncbi:LptA/OstA family protein [Planctomycetota bacterium]
MQRIAAFCLACLVAAAALAADAPKRKAKAKPGPKKPPKKLERLEVWAESIKYDGGKGTFKFNGNVTVIKGDMRVDCERMDGLIDAKTRRISKVSAVGNVRMVSVGTIERKGEERPKIGPLPKDAWQARCAKADYDLKGGRLVMSGKTKDGRPRLTRGEGYGEADMIIFVPDKGEYELIGSPVIHGRIETGPVQGLTPRKEEPKKKG